MLTGSILTCLVRVRGSAHQPHQAHQSAAQARDAAGGTAGGQQRGRERGGAERARRRSLLQRCKCFSSTSSTNPKTESPGRRAKCSRGAPPPSTSSRSTRWTTPLTSSSYRHQVGTSCCLDNRGPLSGGRIAPLTSASPANHRLLVTVHNFIEVG